MRTTTIPVSAPSWHVVDAAGQTIGFVSSKVSMVLRGKHRPTFSPHQLCGDQVIIVNAAKLAVSPEKGRRKTYFHHTGYLGHHHVKSLAKMMEESPSKVIEMAVYGMLPKNRLRPQMLKRMHVVDGPEHKYAAQKPKPLDLNII
ncbi:50S ribosomal protein L13 [Candidatus Peribacteria bacterium]|nr:50S ribosomal protein L13 [Candidatus Peribacteria bacterium]